MTFFHFAQRAYLDNNIEIVVIRRAIALFGNSYTCIQELHISLAWRDLRPKTLN